MAFAVITVAVAIETLAQSLSAYDGHAVQNLRRIKDKAPQAIADEQWIWGGSGSLMDQAIVGGVRGNARRHFEAAAVTLGHALKEAGARNQRMESWVSTFEEWAKSGV